MKCTKALLSVAVLSALWAATPANALPIIDFVDPTDTTITFGSTPSPCPAGFTCTTSALSFVHDITDNGFALADTITSATVAIHLTDPPGGGSEDYTFSIGLAAQTFSSNGVPSGGGGKTDTVIFNVPSLADLQLDGMIGISVSSTSGSFLFADSLLTAQVTKFVVPDPNQIIPAPPTLLLLGAGLAAFGWRFRRRS